MIDQRASSIMLDAGVGKMIGRRSVSCRLRDEAFLSALSYSLVKGLLNQNQAIDVDLIYDSQ